MTYAACNSVRHLGLCASYNERIVRELPDEIMARDAADYGYLYQITYLSCTEENRPNSKH